MRKIVALASVWRIWLALGAAGASALGCAGSAQTAQTGADPPPPPDPGEIVRARDGGAGPIFQLRDGLVQEEAETSEAHPPTGAGAADDDEERASE
jgi:hypothetical protein